VDGFGRTAIKELRRSKGARARRRTHLPDQPYRPDQSHINRSDRRGVSSTALRQHHATDSFGPGEDNQMKTALRRILSESARLNIPAESFTDDADLYAAGLSSLATVHLMLAIEDEFDVEIPDRMLTRRLFSSIDSMAAAITELQQAKAAT
jgi:acyl carrier protein